jgi:ribosome biogenesis GTPase
MPDPRLRLPLLLVLPQKTSWLAATTTRPRGGSLPMLHHLRARLAAVAAPAPAPRPCCPAPVSGTYHWAWQPLGASIGGGARGGAAAFASAASAGAAVAAAAAARRSRPRPRAAGAAAAARDAAAPADDNQQQQQQQQQYALGQVMTAQANFVRVRLHRALPPGAALPPLGDRAGEEALLRLWRGGGDDGDGGAASSSSSSSSSLSLAPHQHQGPLLLCTVRGLLKKLGQPVLVGDRVVVSTTAAAAAAGGGASSSSSPAAPTTATADRGVVARVLPPTRPPLRDPPVANADHVVLLLSLAQPPFEPLAASRFLVSVAAAGLPVTVALNKCDLVGPEEAERRAAQVRAWGYAQPGQVVCVSCETGEGLPELARRLGGGRTSVVAGPSGAGKSSMINALLARLGVVRGGPAGSIGASGMFFEAEDGEEGRPCMEEEDDEEEEEGDDGGGCGGDDDDDPDDVFGRASRSEGGDDDDDIFGLRRDAAGMDDDPLGPHDADAARSSSGPPPAAAAAASLAVGAVSARSGRGRHTTRTVTLVPVPAAALGGGGGGQDGAAAGGGLGGLLADTPGFSMPSLEGVTSAGLGALFPDFAAAQEAAAAAGAAAAAAAAGGPAPSSSSGGGSGSSSTGCRFTDCLHVAEPGCAVLAAVEAALDAADAAGGPGGGAPPSPGAAAALVDPERLEHYYRFLSEVKEREAEDVRAMQEAKRRREGATKAVVGRGGAVRQEVRLDASKHRAVSRRAGKQAAMRDMIGDEDDDGIDGGDDDGGGGVRLSRRGPPGGRGGGGGGGGGGGNSGGGGGRGRRGKVR